MDTQTVTIIATIIALVFIASFLTRKFRQRKAVNTTAEDIEETEDSVETMDCPACLGTGGHYINSDENGEAEYEECEQCDGGGKVPDRRTREQKLDDWEKQPGLLVKCGVCTGLGTTYNRINSAIKRQACSKCNGYGKTWDLRTPEQREADQIAEEEIIASERIRRMAAEDALGINDYDCVNKDTAEQLDAYAEKVSQLEDKIAKLERDHLSELKYRTKDIEDSCKSMTATLNGVAKDVGYIVSAIGFAALMVLGLGTCSDDKKKEPKVTLKDVNATVQSIERTVDYLEERLDEIHPKKKNRYY